MNIKQNKKFIALIIQSLLFVSAISSILQIYKYYTNKHKDYISIKSDKENILNINHTNIEYELIKNLNYVKDYISQFLIVKQQILEHTILGGRINKNDKTSKRYKESQLGWFSSNIKWVNRYAYQTKATIENSNYKLELENKNISKLITIINNHPYTYQYYLNKYGIIIPNINFFLKNRNSSVLSTDTNTTNIYNNIFDVSSNYININSISLNSEETGINAKAITLAGSSIAAAVFKKITFSAKIITYDIDSNSYEYAKPISKDIINNSVVRNLSKDNIFKSNASEISNSNYSYSKNSLHLKFNQIILSNSISSSYKIKPIIIIPNDINFPDYFNTHSKVVAKAAVEYNKIIQFKHNIGLYLLLGNIIASTMIIWIYSVAVRIIIISRIKLLRKIVNNSISIKSTNINDNESTQTHKVYNYITESKETSKAKVVEISSDIIDKINELSRIQDKYEFTKSVRLLRIKIEEMYLNTKLYCNDDKETLLNYNSRIDDMNQRINHVVEARRSEKIPFLEESRILFYKKLKEIEQKLEIINSIKSINELDIFQISIDEKLNFLQAKRINTEMDITDIIAIEKEISRIKRLLYKKCSDYKNRTIQEELLLKRNYELMSNELGGIENYIQRFTLEESEEGALLFIKLVSDKLFHAVNNNKEKKLNKVDKDLLNARMLRIKNNDKILAANEKIQFARDMVKKQIPNVGKKLTDVNNILELAEKL